MLRKMYALMPILTNGSEYIEGNTITNSLRDNILVPWVYPFLFGTIGAVIIIAGFMVFFKFISATDERKKEQAHTALKNLILGVLVLAVILLISGLLPTVLVEFIPKPE